MKSCQYKSSDELPLILNVQEVSNFLGLGLSQVYELVKRIDFPAFKVGSRIFVPKDKFLTWLNVQTEEKDSLFYAANPAQRRSSGCDDDAARCKDPRMQSYGCI